MIARPCVVLYLFICACVYFEVTQQDHSSNRTALYILALLPYSDANPDLYHSWDKGSDILPAAELAVEHINKKSDVLRLYQLHLISGDGGCDVVSEAVVNFVRHVFSPTQQIVGIVGPGCSASSIAVSSLASKNTTALVTLHLGTMDVLGDRTRYPYSFGILGPSHSYVKTIIALLRRNKWENVAVLYNSKSLFFRSTFKKFQTKLPDSVSNISFFSDISDPYIPLTEIREKLTRIILVFASPYFARRVMCSAYHKGLLFPTFQWVFLHGDLAEFTGALSFRYKGNVYECTGDVMLTALRGSLMIRFRMSPTELNTTSSFGIMYSDYLELYRRKVNIENSSQSVVTPSVWAGPVYDAVWALALALNNSLVNLTGYQHGQSDITRVIRSHIHKVAFEGISGRVKFDHETGFVNRTVCIYQLFGVQEYFIAYYDGENITTLNGKHAEFVDNNFPISPLAVNVPLAMVFLVSTITLLALVVANHLVMIVYSDYRSVKASSPKLNHVLFFGCYVMIAGTIVFIIMKAFPFAAPHDENICQAMWAWLFAPGYTLIFGTLMARTWRIYRIFIHFNDPGPYISDRVLVALVLFLLLIDLVIGITWTAVDPFKVVHVRRWFVSEESRAQQMIVHTFCALEHPSVWHGVPLGYKLFLLVVVVTLSLLTRSIKKKDFATRSLTILVYSQVFVLGLGFPAYAFLRYMYVNNNIDFVILCVTLNAIIFLCFSLVLLPPVVPLLCEKYRNARIRYCK